MAITIHRRLLVAACIPWLTACPTPTDPSPSPDDDACPFFTVCWELGSLDLPSGGPRTATVRGNVLLGEEPLSGPLPQPWVLMVPLIPDSLPLGPPIVVDVGSAGYDLAYDEYRVSLDSAFAERGYCHGPVRILEPASGREVVMDLLDPSTTCSGEVEGPDIQLPESVPISIQGSISRMGSPVAAEVDVAFTVPGFEAYASTWVVASGTSTEDGSFSLAGVLPESGCSRVGIRVDSTFTDLGGCGEQTIEIDLPASHE